MSNPISGAAAALGVAQLATRAVSQSIQSSVEVASSFAEVLGETLSEQDTETLAPSTEKTRGNAAESTAAKSSLRKLLSDWMRHFGLQGNEPIEVRMDPGRDSIRITSQDASPENSRKISNLQTRLNTDDSLRRSVVDSLRSLPDECFTMSS